MNDTATLGLRSVAEDDGQPSVLTRHLLGFAVLLITVIPGYLLTRPGGVPTLTSEAEADTDAAAVAAAVVDESVDEEPVAEPAEEPKPRLTMTDIHAHIKQVALRHGISPLLVAAIIEAESEFNPRAVSRKGARGLMQLMPATASSLSVRNSFDPYENIDGGVRHLRRLLDRFHGNIPLAVAAYNAGEQTVINYHGVPPYRETRRYVAKILRRINYRGVAVIYGSSNRRVVMTESTMRPQIRPAVYVPPTRPEPRPEPRREAEPVHRETVRPEPRREILGPWAPTPMIRSVAASPRTSAIVSGVPSESP